MAFVRLQSNTFLESGSGSRWTFQGMAQFFTNVPNAMRTNPSWHNFAPRFGFAYDPFANHKTSIRGGFGMFYDPVLPSVYAPVYWNTPPFQQVQVGLGVQGTVAPFYPNIPATGSSPLPFTTTGFDWNSNTTPYTMQYNFNIQREIAQGTIVTLGYVGSRGDHLMSQIERNPAPGSLIPPE